MAAPATEIDPSMLPLIAKWDSPMPTALQVLEVLDICIYSALASSFAISALQSTYEGCLKIEGSTHEDVVKHATNWRNNL
jgi:hypothetical protein